MPRFDRHALYEASVQSVDTDVAFLAGVFRRKRGRPARRLREDFCGTAALSAAWLRLHRDNRAVGVDLDREVLAWAREHRVPKLGDAASRLSLVRADVRSNRVPKGDLTLALNFSYCVFKERAGLLEYVRAARAGLRPGGLFVVNAFGGTEAMESLEERSRKKGFVQDDGTRVPAFTYVWEHEHFNPVDHHILCHIHYEFPDGTSMRNAFTYDWRLWTLPELRELCAEAGFASTDVYLEGWDDEAGESSHVYRKRTRFENQAGWLAYVMAWV